MHKQLRERSLALAQVKAEYDQQVSEFLLLDQFLDARAEQNTNELTGAEGALAKIADLLTMPGVEDIDFETPRPNDVTQSA